MSKIVCLALFSLMMHRVFGECGESCFMQNFALQGEVLYWQARGSNINYISNFQNLGIKGLANSTTYLQAIDITRESVHYNRDVGGRLSLIYHSPYEEEFQGALRWTYFATSAYGKPHVPPSVLDRAFKTVDYQEETKWRLNLNFWDFEMTRELVTDPCLTIDIFAGVRGASLRQRYRSNDQFVFKKLRSSRKSAVSTEEEGGEELFAAKTLSGSLSFFNNQVLFDIDEYHRFYGAGPRIGLNAFWDLGCGFCLYGDLAGSFLVGFSRHTVCDDALTQLKFFVDQTLWERDETLQANRGIVDLSGGIAWSPSWKRLCCPWVFRLGFENHTIFGQKKAYFGQDLIPLVIDQAGPVRYAPQVTGSCKSTLSVYGVVFSASYTY